MASYCFSTYGSCPLRLDLEPGIGRYDHRITTQLTNLSMHGKNMTSVCGFTCSGSTLAGLE